MGYRIIFFILLNFAALAIGSYFTENGVSSDWYASLKKAPWNPPGWLFGVAWTTIMICFAVYMAYGTKYINTKGLLAAFAVQWVLNVVWNPIFFHLHDVFLALIVIILLTVLILIMFIAYWSRMKTKSFWLAPYLIWMFLATSLNAYIYFMNQ